MVWAKNPESFEKKKLQILRYFTFYILVECPVYVREQKDKTESILLRSDYDTPSQYFGA